LPSAWVSTPRSLWLRDRAILVSVLVSMGLTPAPTTPVAPDIGQPQSGLANPAAGVPFGAVPAGVAGDQNDP
jgi:hypothetical protein